MTTPNGARAPHLLATWLARHDLSQRELARRLEVTEAAVSAWVLGTRRPERHRDAIERITGGAVRAGAWDTPAERRARARLAKIGAFVAKARP